MSGYQRFVAYVYEYRKGKKENNCGFIKVEVKEKKCRMEVYLKCPGLTPGAECSIYGFIRNAGLMDSFLLGKCRTEEGSTGCVLETKAENMGSSGIALRKMGGMLLKTENGAFFGTEWDDQPIRPENFREIRPQIERVEEEKKEKAEEDKEETSEISEPEETEKDEETAEETAERTVEEPIEESEETGGIGETIEETKELIKEEIKEEVNEIEEIKNEETECDDSEMEEAAEPEVQEEENDITSQSVQTEEMMLEPEKSVERKINFADFAQSWNFGEECEAFEDGEIMDCRKIQLKDLVRLQRRDCALRNNRFLLYGYYNFGHLLLARKRTGGCILGVPGGYDQQERFMANMFGFPYFKESRSIELPRGRGGYWYRLINTPNSN